MFCWLFCISQALQKIIVRAQIRLRELAGIDYTMEGYTDGCMVEMSNCYEFVDAASCDHRIVADCCCYHNPGVWEYFCTTTAECTKHGDTCYDQSNCDGGSCSTTDPVATPCAWSLYDEGNPEGGGFCGGDRDRGFGAEEEFCAGESGRHMETIIDVDTSDLVSSLATTVADALDVRGPCFQLGIFLICHFD